jgi:hypothetical protein
MQEQGEGQEEAGREQELGREKGREKDVSLMTLEELAKQAMGVTPL